MFYVILLSIEYIARTFNLQKEFAINIKKNFCNFFRILQEF